MSFIKTFIKYVIFFERLWADLRTPQTHYFTINQKQYLANLFFTGWHGW